MSTKQLQVYKCEVCGMIVEVLDGGAGELVCCRMPMQGLDEQTEDASKEKHVPFIEKTDDGYTTYLSALPVFSYKHNRGSVSYKTFNEAKTGMAQWLFQGLRYENSTSG